MQEEWQEFLRDAGMDYADGQPAGFGNPGRELSIATTGNIFCDLSHMGLISVQGSDARTFLQGQFSNDISSVTESTTQLSTYCNPKGRMLASFRVFVRSEVFYLRLPKTLVEPLLKRLKTFVLRAKVTLEDASDSLVRIGHSGPQAVTELEDALGSAPHNIDDAVQSGDYTALRIPGPLPRFEIYAELEPMKKLWAILNVHGAPVGPEPWAYLDILAGIPNIFPETSEAFVPQMANMELVNAVSFTKGCYPGQEIVARTQHLGKLKRRTYRLHAPVDQAPAPGVEIFADGDNAQAQGVVVDARPDPDGGTAMLAVLQIDSAEHKTLRFAHEQGPVLEVRPLPYELNPTSDGAP